MAWPLAAHAQLQALPLIGILQALSPGTAADNLAAFRQGLSDTGYVEHRNVGIEYRWAEGHYDRLPGLAADLVGRKVAVIATNGPAALVAKAATTTIPIVFTGGFDPIAAGLVASLNRPGGNVTGVTVLSGELGPKGLELLHELVPTATVIALLVNPTNPLGENPMRDVQAAANTFGLQIRVLHASTERDLDTAFATLAQLRAGGLVIGNDAFFAARGEQLGALALRHAVPAISLSRAFAAAGGVMGYGGDGAEMYHIAGVYTGRILKGEKPADLPIQQSGKVELVINLKTAKALGLEVPATLLARADKVIE